MLASESSPAISSQKRGPTQSLGPKPSAPPALLPLGYCSDTHRRITTRFFVYSFSLFFVSVPCARLRWPSHGSHGSTEEWWDSPIWLRFGTESWFFRPEWKWHVWWTVVTLLKFVAISEHVTFAAATGKARPPSVNRRKNATSIEISIDADLSLRRCGMSATQVNDKVR